MKPGTHPWADNDVYAAGPDVGSNTKTETLALHRGDGYARSRRPSPDNLNWQLNRGGVAHKLLSKIQSGNYTLEDSTASPAASVLATACWTLNNEGNINVFLYDGVNTISERRGIQGRIWSIPASSPVSAAAGVVTLIDSASDDVNNRVICASSGVNNQVHYNNSYAGGSWAASAIAVNVSAGWSAIGCDANTAGGANALWLIGDDTTNTNPGAGNGILNSSVNLGANFAAVGTWPAIAEPILCIEHSHHAAGALGPDDAGNPTWLILTTTRAVSSADGATWTNSAHGLGIAANKDSLAYSKCERRWVWPIGGADVVYSDDNGVTWVTLNNVLAGSTGVPADMHIQGDGYGTFVIVDDSNVSRERFWVSVDDGITWTRGDLTGLIGGTSTEVIIAFGGDNTENFDDNNIIQNHFSIMHYDAAGPLFTAVRSLAY
jgi:hypothetical protein